MEGSMLRHQLVRDGENADQALDRMIAETRSTARQRSSPPDSHAVRRLRNLVVEETLGMLVLTLIL